jgi:zinc transport system permease protein
MIDDFLVRAAAAGVAVALAGGPLGCLVVWRRMAYFGDALAHGALLGVVLGLAAGIDPQLGTAAICLALALLLILLRRQRRLASDTLLGILSHGALAAGLVGASLMAAFNADLLAYLFGDILAVGTKDLAWIFGASALAIIALAVAWRPLLASTVHEELAMAEGFKVDRANLLLMLAMAGFVAVAMKAVGVLLTTAMLIVPAATARRFARTPEEMAGFASLSGALAVILGLAGATAFDTPAGPSIVLAAMALFAVSLALPDRL